MFNFFSKISPTKETSSFVPNTVRPTTPKNIPKRTREATSPPTTEQKKHKTVKPKSVSATASGSAASDNMDEAEFGESGSNIEINSDMDALKDMMQTLLQQSENRQNEQRKNEMQELTNSFKEHLEPLKAIADKLPILEFEISNLKQRISSLEKHDKKLNVIIHGLREVEKEGVKERDDVIKQLATLLRLPAIDYADAYRVGRNINNKPRPLIVKLIRFKDKIDILKSKRQLKGTDVFINDDLTTDERKSNSKLQEKKSDIMRINNRAKCSIRFGKLHVESEGKHETFYVNPVTFEVEQRALPSQRAFHSQRPYTLSGQSQRNARL
jgi:hypothetical protein